MEVGFEGSDPASEETDFLFTTEIHIIPDTLPFDRCTSEDECRGQLKWTVLPSFVSSEFWYIDF